MKYYAVKNGRQNGVYTNWSDCESQVKGHSGSQFKSFKTQAEAKAYMSGGSNSNSGANRSTSNHNGSSYSSSRSNAPYSKTSRSSSSGSNQHASYSSGYVSHVPTSHSTKSSKPVKVYTDGASKNNQAAKQGKATAGYGVYYGPNDSRNYSGRVSGEQTNNRGELQAISHALGNAAAEVKSGKTNHYNIITDSQYSMDSITKWSSGWEKNGWKTSTGAPVQNRDLIQNCRKHIADIESHQGKVEFTKVKGHSGDHGNEMADKLAVDGCHK